MKKNKNIPLNLREQMNSRIGLICSVILLLLLVAGLRQLDYNLIEKPKEEAAKVAQKEAEAAKKAAEEPEVSTASVIAVGDNLYHGSLIESGENDSGTWNYDQIYDKVRDEIQAADVAMVDQETVFTTEHDAVSSYPSFATPTEVGDALMNAGFDVVESATNHIDDYGIDFLQETFNFWSSKYPDVPVLGIHPTQEDADIFPVILHCILCFDRWKLRYAILQSGKIFFLVHPKSSLFCEAKSESIDEERILASLFCEAKSESIDEDMACGHALILASLFIRIPSSLSL